MNLTKKRTWIAAVFLALAHVLGAWGATVQVASSQALQDAVAAANAGDTIQLTADVTLDATLQISKSITLDLNGKTLSKTLASTTDKTPVVKALSGTVEIKNGTITYDLSTYTGTGSTSNANLIYLGMNMSNGVYSYGDCTLTLNGVNASVTFPKGKSLAMIYVESGRLNVVDSNLSASNASGNTSKQYIIYTTTHSSAQANAYVSISGTTVIDTNSSPALNAIWLQGADDTLVISGDNVVVNANGVYTQYGSANYAYAVNNQSGATCTIEGGSFDGKVWATKGTITVYGGNFSYAQGTSGQKNKFTLAEGVEFVENTDPATKDQYPYVVAVPQPPVDLGSVTLWVSGSDKWYFELGFEYTKYDQEDAEEVEDYYNPIVADTTVVTITNYDASAMFDGATALGKIHAVAAGETTIECQIADYDEDYNDILVPARFTVVVRAPDPDAPAVLGYSSIGGYAIGFATEDGDTIASLTAEAAEMGLTVVASGTYSEMTNLKENMVAKIGNVPYLSLAAAVTAAQSGDTITMLADDTVSLTGGAEITINKSLTITGPVAANGEPLYTIYGKNTVAGYNDIFITGAGTVTLSNVKIAQFGNNAASDSGHAPVYVSQNFTGTVNLDNVYISEFNRAGMALCGGTFNVTDCYIDCAQSRAGAFTKGIEIKGSATGTIKDTVIVNMERGATASDAPAGIEVYGNGSIVVDGCTIISDVDPHQSGKATYGIVSSRVGVNDPSGGTLLVTNCYIDVSNGALSVADSDEYGPVNDYTIVVGGEDTYFSNYIAIWSTGSEITINEGEFTEDVYADAGTITITGGTFNNFAPDTGTGTISISGGIFDDEVPEEYCAEGYIPAVYDEDTGLYTVEEGTYVAQIGSTKYTTLAAAVSAATAGDTIMLLTDITDYTGTTLVSKSLTINGAGHTITAVAVPEGGHRDMINAFTGGTSMLKISSGAVTVTNITFNGHATHAYTYLIEVVNSGSSLTVGDISLVNGGELDNSGTPGAGYGAAIHVNNASLVVKDGFYACTGGEEDGVFPFTGILPEGDASVRFDLVEDTNATPTVDIGNDLLLVGMIGVIPLNQAQDILDYMQVPSRFIPYTLTLGDGSAYAFTGASPRTWNDIIDYGKAIMDVSTSLGYEGLDKDTTPVEVGLLENTAIPGTFRFADTNFTVNGNGYELTGTIKYTASAGELKNVVLTSDTILDISAEGATVNFGEGVSIAVGEKVKLVIGELSPGQDLADNVGDLTIDDFDLYVHHAQTGDLVPVTSANIADYLPEDYKIDKIVEEDGTTKDLVVVRKVYVAQIVSGATTNKFESLAAAFAGAQSGDTIQMIADSAETAGGTVTSGKTIVLDLNGKAITCTSAFPAAFDLIAVNGSLTVDDTSAGGDGSIALTSTANLSWDYAVNMFIVGNGGSLTIEKGSYTISTPGHGWAEYIIAASNNSGSSTVVVNGGTFTGTKVDAVVRLHDQYGRSQPLNVTINGGDFTLNGGSDSVIWFDVQKSGSGTDNASAASLVINGGTFTSDNASPALDLGHSVDASGLRVTVTGGAFKSTGAVIKTRELSAAAIANIKLSGGIYSGDEYYNDLTSETAKLNTLCADGYACLANPDSATVGSYPWAVQPVFTVSFVNAKGDAPAAQTVVSNQVATAPSPAPTAADFVFLGWFAEGAAAAYDFATPVTTNLTLTAQWASAVAQIVSGATTNKFESLAAAFAGAQSGDTVQMIADSAETAGGTVASGKTIVLDLNGKAITCTSAFPAAFNLIAVNGSLTVDDTSAGADGSIALTSTANLSWDYAVNMFIVGNGGSLTIEKGDYSVTTPSYGYAEYVIAASNNSGSSDVTVNGGTFTGNNIDAIVRLHDQYGRNGHLNVTVNGGDFTLNGGQCDSVIWFDVQNSGSGTDNISAASLAINGGTFTSTSSSPALDLGHSVDASGLRVTVTGGAFKSEGAVIKTRELSAAAIANIKLSGGIYSGDEYYDDLTSETAKLNTLCADGYACLANPDSATVGSYPWTVVQTAYTVIFQNYDGTGLQTNVVMVGEETPSYTGETPAKQGGGFVYQFDGWTAASDSTFYAATNALPAIVADETFTAHFVETASYLDAISWSGAVAPEEGDPRQPVQEVSVQQRTGNALRIHRTADENDCLRPIGEADDDLRISWNTSDSAIATIDGNGLLTFHDLGTVTVTVTVTDAFGHARSSSSAVTYRLWPQNLRITSLDYENRLLWYDCGTEEELVAFMPSAVENGNLRTVYCTFLTATDLAATEWTAVNNSFVWEKNDEGRVGWRSFGPIDTSASRRFWRLVVTLEQLKVGDTVSFGSQATGN